MDVPEQHLIDLALRIANDLQIKARSVVIDDSSKGQQECFAKLKNNRIIISEKAVQECTDDQIKHLLFISLIKPRDSIYDAIQFASLIPLFVLVRYFRHDPYIIIALVVLYLCFFGVLSWLSVRAYKRYLKMVESKISKIKNT